MFSSPDVCSASTSPSTAQRHKVEAVQAPKGFTAAFAAACLKEVGVREIGCNNCGTRVEQYLRSTGNRKGDPYCQAFVYCIAKETAERLKCTNIIPRTALASASRIKLQKAANAKLPPVPPPARLIYWQYPKSASGHVDVGVKDIGGGWIQCVSANSGRAGTARDGQGGNAGVNLTKRNPNHPLARMQCRSVIAIV